MRLNPASGINAKDGQIILRFLLYYMHQREDEQRGDEDSESAPDAEGSGAEVPEAAPPSAAELSSASTVEPVVPSPATARSMAEPRPSEMNP